MRTLTGTVSVTIRVEGARRDSFEGGLVEERVGRARVDPCRPGLLERLRARVKRPPRVDHVVRHHGDLALDLADDAGDARQVVPRPLLVEDDETTADHLRRTCRRARATHVRRNRNARDMPAEEVTDVLREHRHRDHVVDGDPEEPLHLAGVRIHRDHAVDADGLQEVGRHAAVIGSRGRDFLSWSGVEVPGYAVIRFADASFAAFPMIGRSTRCSATGLAAVCTMNMSAPRTRFVITAVTLAFRGGFKDPGAEVDTQVVRDPTRELR